MLRTKGYFLACSLALTTMSGLEAHAFVQNHTLKQALPAKQKPKLPPRAEVKLPVGNTNVATKPSPKQPGMKHELLQHKKFAVAKAQVPAQPSAVQDTPRGKIRQVPAKKEQRAYQEMAQVAKQNKASLKKLGTKKNALKTFQTKGLFSKKQTHFSKPKHSIKERAPNGDAITIEDGSAWTIKDKDQQTVRSWSENAPITFTANSLSIWSKLLRRPLIHKYRIVNLHTKESVEANLSLGPFVHNPNTRRIRKIALTRGEVVFSNGTLWRCDTSKASQKLLQDWRVGDFVITGTNNTWFGLGQQEIVINVSSNNWVSAQRLL
jgi:hypothetical protein